MVRLVYFLVLRMRYLFLLFFSFLSAILFAENVPVERAKVLAGHFFQFSPASAGTGVSVRLVGKDENRLTRAGGEAPAYYVFNNDNGKGFVIVAGDDVVMPVLGYSFENSFPQEDLPDNLQSWLEGLRGQINAARRDRLKSTPAVKQAWDTKNTGNPVVKLETALWDQEIPYNKDCPVIQGKRTYTGCTMTAMAIVMKYHEWPDMGTGTIPGYITPTYKYRVPDRVLDHPYNWAKMPLTYHSYSTEEEDEVAALMYDCGVMLQANYKPVGSSGTEAYLMDIASGLSTYMKYDKSARYLGRSSYSDEEWHELLQKELKERRPVIYSGRNDKGGHTFVLDGYTQDRYYSVNWGWGGRCNGYFLLSALEPYEQGAGGAGRHYNEIQSAVLGLKKDEGGDYAEEIRFEKDDASGINGFATQETSFEMDKPFRVSAGFILNAGSAKYNGAIMFGLTDKTGQIKQQLYFRSVGGWLPRSGQIYRDIQLTITVPVEGGDRIRAFYKSSATQEWILIRGNEDEGCVWELLAAAEPSLEAGTSVAYNKRTRMLTLQVTDDVEVRLFAADGTDHSQHCEAQGNGFRIDTSVLPAGLYILKLQKAKEYKELKFTIGASEQRWFVLKSRNL